MRGALPSERGDWRQRGRREPEYPTHPLADRVEVLRSQRAVEAEFSSQAPAQLVTLAVERLEHGSPRRLDKSPACGESLAIAFPPVIIAGEQIRDRQADRAGDDVHLAPGEAPKERLRLAPLCDRQGALAVAGGACGAEFAGIPAHPV
jgi:hypothetical protein